MPEDDPVTLCEVLDRVLTKGVVVSGDLTISVANVELIYVGVRLLLSSVETLTRSGGFPGGESPRVYLDTLQAIAGGAPDNCARGSRTEGHTHDTA